jgi:tRNA(fMet)-specific endonuclease VapC
MKGLFDLKNKIQKAGAENCFISEITLAELKFGVENSQAKEKNTKALAGQPLDDFDLLITIYNSLLSPNNKLPIRTILLPSSTAII